MAQVKFGLGQTGNPTPSKINTIVMIITVVFSTLSLWMTGNSLFSAHTQTVMISINSLVTGLSNAIRPFFGVQITQSAIPTESATAVDETKIDQITPSKP